MDLHTRVNVLDVLQVNLDNDCVLFQVSYKVKRGRKVYKLWCLSEDLKGCGILPLVCHGQDVLTQKNQVIYSGMLAGKVTRITNRRYFQSLMQDKSLA